MFRELPEEALARRVLPLGQLLEPARDSVLIAPGDRVDWFAVVLRRRVRISQLFSDGTDSLMDALEPARTLGTDLICTRTLRSPYYAVAGADLVLLRLPRDMLLEPGALPEAERLTLCRSLLTLLSDDDLRKYYRLAILSQRGLRARILTYLVMQAERRGTPSFRIPFSREELARFLCVDRSALSHELSRM